MKLAVDAAEGSALWEPLISHAITAYTRPFILSKVRARLDHMPEFPGIPNELQDVHDTVRKYRNTTIAHSQSDLVMPLPIAILDDTGNGKDVIGVTLIHPVPGAFIGHFADLIMAMEDLVDQATQPVLKRLRAWLNLDPPMLMGDRRS
ncbi:hypothetical protein IWX75_003586 [Arthrobacter sp. CAN_A6]|uniref:hypothetical protein n=1 Tax=Arthrobacter sp. CAN_A6 TaxID=2787721 RepID=UPI0018C92CD2